MTAPNSIASCFVTAFDNDSLRVLLAPVIQPIGVHEEGGSPVRRRIRLPCRAKGAAGRVPDDADVHLLERLADAVG